VLEKNLQDLRAEEAEKEREKFITQKENEFLEKKVEELGSDVNKQIEKIQEELRSKNQSIGIL
jgi:uncharacterized protein (DUF342 family)